MNCKAALALVSVLVCSMAHGETGDPPWCTADQDADIVSRMSTPQLALAALSLRTDLGLYDRHDLGTVSGQYELFYREVMGGCVQGDRADSNGGICPGRSLSESFFDYLHGPHRICRAMHSDSCAKPAYAPRRLRDELLELIRIKRAAREAVALCRSADRHRLTTTLPTTAAPSTTR